MSPPPNLTTSSTTDCLMLTPHATLAPTQVLPWDETHDSEASIQKG